MDVGCYAIHCIRTLAGAEPEVVRAHALLRAPDLDRAMEADFRFADGRTARMVCSLLSSRLLDATATVTGADGELRVVNPFVPHFPYHRLIVRNGRGRYVEDVRGDATYTYQLRAFLRAVRTGEPVPTGPADAIANMRAIDSVYVKSGLRPRGR
jgi:predicted dehydrogenase